MAEHPLFSWELWLADCHYTGINQLITPYKRHHPLTDAELAYNIIHSFYRARVEHSIRRIKIHSIMNEVYRGSWEVLNNAMIIIAHTTNVENRLRPKYAYYGPWLHFVY